MHIPSYTLRARRLNTPPDLVPSLPPTSLREVDRDAWVLGAHLRQSRHQAFFRGVLIGFGAAFFSMAVGLALSRFSRPDASEPRGASTASMTPSGTPSAVPLSRSLSRVEPKAIDPRASLDRPATPIVPASSVLHRAQPAASLARPLSSSVAASSVASSGWTLVGTPTPDYALIALPSGQGRVVLPVRVGQHLPDGSVLESIRDGQIITSADVVSASH